RGRKQFRRDSPKTSQLHCRRGRKAGAREHHIDRCCLHVRRCISLRNAQGAAIRSQQRLRNLLGVVIGQRGIEGGGTRRSLRNHRDRARHAEVVRSRKVRRRDRLNCGRGNSQYRCTLHLRRRDRRRAAKTCIEANLVLALRKVGQCSCQSQRCSIRTRGDESWAHGLNLKLLRLNLWQQPCDRERSSEQDGQYPADPLRRRTNGHRTRYLGSQRHYGVPFAMAGTNSICGLVPVRFTVQTGPLYSGFRRNVLPPASCPSSVGWQAHASFAVAVPPVRSTRKTLPSPPSAMTAHRPSREPATATG